MISKADETRVFYFSLSSRQVVLVAIGDIFKGVYSSTSDGQVVFARRLSYNRLRVRPFPSEKVPEVGDW